jgi:V/A-type H+-transporting ATPase subunit I
MLRPERMSRVSVTGSKQVLEDTVEVLYDLDLVHLSEYENTIEGFSPGESMAGADDVSDKLVTVRALESILGVTEDDADEGTVLADDRLEAELAEVREEVNDLDDRQDELSDELRAVEEEIDQLSLFVDLGIDLDLLGGYDSLEVAVGEGDPETVEATLAEEDIDTYEVFSGERAVAVFASVEDRGVLEDALVGASFTAVPVPDGTGDPESYLADRRERKAELEAELEAVEEDLEALREDVGGFLLAAEEQLTIEAEKREAPIAFATTANAFVAEGWMPTEQVSTLESALESSVGDRVDVEELERADYDDDGAVHDHGPVENDDHETGSVTEADDEDETESEPPKAAADGGYVTLADDDPPVVQDNPGGTVKPFESLVQVINRPKYSELDPTVILFLTFPAFFGFMIGDLGYGLLYMATGYYLLRAFDSDVMKSFGGIALWSGGFTALFGILYGEFFGLRQLGYILWGTSESAGLIDIGGAPIHKGLQPHYAYYAQAWLLLSVVLGVVHLVIGRVFDFANNLDHGLKDAVFESGSWIMLTVGLWTWVFSTHIAGPKPDFMFTVFDSGDGAALALGFSGLPEVVGIAGLVVAGVGFVLALVAEGGIVIVESITEAFGHVVSYTRIAAVLLAKAGMALAVNLLVFGATLHDGEFHLIWFADSYAEADVVFGGLLNLEGPVGLILGVLVGIVILVLGHLLVLVLGISSAGLQAVRLEYVEFFGKFYEGGGTPYSPLGRERTYTTDE